MLVLLRCTSSDFTDLPFFLCLHFPSTPPTSSPSFLPWLLLPLHFDGVILLPHPFLLPWSSRFPLLLFRHPATFRHHCHHLYLLLLFCALCLRFICLFCRNSLPFALGSHFVFLLRLLTRSCLSSSLYLQFSLTLPRLSPYFIARGSPTQSFPASLTLFNPTSLSMAFHPTNGSLWPPSLIPQTPQLISHP